MFFRKSTLLALLLLAILLAACRQAEPQEVTPPPQATGFPGESRAPTATATLISTPLPLPAPTATTGARVDTRLMPALAELPEGWTRIEPGGETRCAHNTPYAFWVRPGAGDKVLVFLQGGGACWDAETCAPGSQYYKQAVTEADNPAFGAGIFDLDNPENPFRDHSMIFIPSCTGDIYWGNKDRQYQPSTGGEFTVYHRGFVNANAAAQWVYDNFSAPASLFVSGCSAGSAGSILLAPYLIAGYPQARVAQLGDSLSITFHLAQQLEEAYNALENFPEWIPALDEVQPGVFSLADLYIAVAEYYPQATFSQYNTRQDQVQEFFYLASTGKRGSFPQALQANLDQIHAAVDNFRSFTAPGSAHCILPSDRFYSEAVSGVRFRDWVANLAIGLEAPDVAGD